METKTLFEHLDGMTVKGSTFFERKEIWKLLFEKNLIYSQYPTIEEELENLNINSFYINNVDGKFVPDSSEGVNVVNVPFEEFKKRLSQL